MAQISVLYSKAFWIKRRSSLNILEGVGTDFWLPQRVARRRRTGARAVVMQVTSRALAAKYHLWDELQVAQTGLNRPKSITVDG